MILAVLFGVGIGAWFVLRGDGAARFLGIVLILISVVFGALLWVGLTQDRPPLDDVRLNPERPRLHV